MFYQELPLSSLLFISTTVVHALNIWPLFKLSQPPLPGIPSPRTTLPHIKDSSLPSMWSGHKSTLLPCPLPPLPPPVVLCHCTQQIQSCLLLHVGTSSPNRISPRVCFFPPVPWMSLSSHSSPIFLLHWHSAPPWGCLRKAVRVLANSGWASTSFCS